MEFLKKVIAGFAIGIGFSVALVVVATLSMNYMIGKMYEDTMSATEKFMYRDYKEEDNKLVILDEVSQKEKDGLTITGSVKNNDEIAWSSINIEVELFDKNGKFVHECSEYIAQKVEPGKSENFKVKCKGCKKNIIPEYETYKVRIVSAHSMFNQ